MGADTGIAIATLADIVVAEELGVLVFEETVVDVVTWDILLGEPSIRPRPTRLA